MSAAVRKSDHLSATSLPTKRDINRRIMPRIHAPALLRSGSDSVLLLKEVQL